MTTIIRRRKLGMSSVRGIAAVSTTGIGWVRSDRPIPNDNLFIRWGCTSNLPEGARVIQKASAIHQVADKASFRMITAEAGLSPESWLSIDDVPEDAWVNGIVFRPRVYSRGRHIWKIHSADRANQLVRRHPNYYLSRWVDKAEEYRVAIVQGRVVWVAKKTPGNPEDLAWNVAQGGRFDNVRWDEWPLKVIRRSVEAFNLSELDFGGVDIMVDRQGEAWVIEINSAPSLTSPYRQQCMAKSFDWIVEHGKERIPLVDRRGGYLKFIHPALNDRAKLVEVV